MKKFSLLLAFFSILILNSGMNNPEPGAEGPYALNNASSTEITSLTNGLPKGTFGAGYQTDEVTNATFWRWSEKYYGFLQLAGIVELTDQCGGSHIYTYGEASGATVEYLMKFGGEFSQLVLRGIADRPSPVLLEVYIDGELKTTAQWIKGDLCNELAYVKVYGIEYGTHAIAIRFINDLWDPDQGIDRNFYLDALMVIPTEEEGMPVYVGDNIQGAVSDNPEGTTFIIKNSDRSGNKGIHRIKPVIPKHGNSFIGEEGSVLSGAVLLDNWREEGQYWVHDGPDGLHNEIYHAGECITFYTESNKIPCQWPEDLFMEDWEYEAGKFKDTTVFCRQVKFLSELTDRSPGVVPTWYFDRDGSRKIYIKGDPSGHKWEISVTGFAFGGQRIIPPWGKDGDDPITDPETIPDNITIRNLIIEKFANPGQLGAIGFQDPGVGWVIEDNEVRWNHSAGIQAGSHSIVRNNFVHNNGQIGIKASRNLVDISHGAAQPPYYVKNALVEGNRIYRNGKKEVGFDWTWEGGGTKFAKTTNLVVRNNIVRENRGAGLWTDIDNTGTIYENNIVENNLDNGIFHEISYSAIIRNNVVRNNGGIIDGEGRTRAISPYGDRYHHAQIQVANSDGVEVYGNLVDAGTDKNGIIVRYDYRAEKGADNLYQSRNVSVHHNQIIVPEGNPYGISGGWINTSSYGDKWKPDPLSEAGHNFDFNVYQIANHDKKYWIWENGDGNDQLLSFVEFQDVKQELSGRKVNISTGARAWYFNDGSGASTSTLIYPVVFGEADRIDFEWTEGSPDIKIGSRIAGEENNFSARYQGTIKAQNSADYYFRITADDGIRFWLKDIRGNFSSLFPVERWENDPANPAPVQIGPLALEKGEMYPFRLEYFHRSMATEKNAMIRLEWKEGNGDWQVVPSGAIGPPHDFPMNGLQGIYYNDPADIQAEKIKLIRTDQQINFNWGDFPPDSRMDDDGVFAVVWEGKIQPLYDGDYYFFTRFNSGIESMTFWIDNPFTKETNQRYRANGLKEGKQYNIRIEYRKTSDEQSSSDVMLEWESLDKRQNFQLVPPYCLYLPDNAKRPEDFPLTEPENGILFDCWNLSSFGINNGFWVNWPGQDAYPGIPSTSNFMKFILEESYNPYRSINVPYINFNWRSGSPDYRIGADYFVTRSQGFIQLPEGEPAGLREFEWDTDDGGILVIADWIRPELEIIDTWTNRDGSKKGRKYMEPGKKYMMTAWHFERGGGASARAVLNWRVINSLRSTGEEEFQVVPPEAFKMPDLDNPFIDALLSVKNGETEYLEGGEIFTSEELHGDFDILALPYPENPSSIVFELDGTPIRTATSPPWLLVGDGTEIINWPPEPGMHQLTAIPYTSTNQPGAGLSIHFEIEHSSSVNIIEESLNWNMYPNPTKDKLFISLKDDSITDAMVTINNIAGEMIFKLLRTGEQLIELDVSHIPPGVYVIEIRTAKWNQSRLLIIL